MALVIKRKVNERVRIGPDIWVTVVEGGDRRGLRLSIEAPAGVRIDREEILPDAEQYRAVARGKAWKFIAPTTP